MSVRAVYEVSRGIQRVFSRVVLGFSTCLGLVGLGGGLGSVRLGLKV